VYKVFVTVDLYILKYKSLGVFHKVHQKDVYHYQVCHYRFVLWAQPEATFFVED